VKIDSASRRSNDSTAPKGRLEREEPVQVVIVSLPWQMAIDVWAHFSDLIQGK
jgi:hypothetical protein